MSLLVRANERDFHPYLFDLHAIGLAFHLLLIRSGGSSSASPAAVAHVSFSGIVSYSKG